MATKPKPCNVITTQEFLPSFVYSAQSKQTASDHGSIFKSRYAHKWVKATHMPTSPFPTSEETKKARQKMENRSEN